MKQAETLGELKQSNYISKDIKTELRDNLLERLRTKTPVFSGIIGYTDTVIPDLQRSILSGHNILLLGLRGQAKTRIARQMVDLLDEFIPIVSGSEMMDDPLNPISKTAKELIQQNGDETPIKWVHRSERYVEKLATPDVNVADLIGDVDPIKAATLKLHYSDESVIHFGLVPRSHRSIFVLNELPDLQARIQVSLFNILEEGDIQIRGFKLRLPLDIQFVFTANPEDYTNRGSIITPLKDRIGSQILTHYPLDVQTAMQITQQEARISQDQQKSISISPIHLELLELISFHARKSEYIDEKSGISARVSISGLENLYSAAERRMLLNNETEAHSRLSDFWGVIPSLTGKLEYVYEGEQEGPYNVALHLIGQSIKELFLRYFPDPASINEHSPKDPYYAIRSFFADGNTVDLGIDQPEEVYNRTIQNIPGLMKLMERFKVNSSELKVFMEIALFALAEFNVIQKEVEPSALTFKDPLAGMLRDIGPI